MLNQENREHFIPLKYTRYTVSSINAVINQASWLIWPGILTRIGVVHTVGRSADHGTMDTPSLSSTAPTRSFEKRQTPGTWVGERLSDLVHVFPLLLFPVMVQHIPRPFLRIHFVLQTIGEVTQDTRCILHSLVCVCVCVCGGGGGGIALISTCRMYVQIHLITKHVQMTITWVRMVRFQYKLMIFWQFKTNVLGPFSTWAIVYM